LLLSLTLFFIKEREFKKFHKKIISHSD